MATTELVRAGRRHRRDHRRAAATVVVPLAAVYLVALAWSMTTGGGDTWSFLVMTPLLLLATWPILRSIHMRDGARAAYLLSTALVLKMLGALVLHGISDSVYGGVADWRLYHEQGQLVADQLRTRFWPIDIGPFPVIGTAFVFILSGVSQLIVGDNVIALDLLFSWMGFLGYLCFFRAYRLMFPDANVTKYVLLLCFVPSMIFWPSTLGKDAWMSLTLGMATLGTARILAHERRGFMLTLLGVVGAGAVRPHIALIFFVAFAPAFLLRRSKQSHVFTIGKVVGLVALVVGGLLIVGQVEQFFGIERLDTRGAKEVLEHTRDQSSIGNSTFETTGLPSIVNLPQSVVTVLFRPFPFEAHNSQAFVAGLEGMLLLGLCLLFHRSLLSIPRRMLREPFLLGCLLYVLLFAAAFGTIGNFGLLARERVQAFPFFFVLMSAPVANWVPWKLRHRPSRIGVPG